MNTPKNRTARAELDRIEDALVDAILNATSEELRSEIKDAGGDPKQLIEEIDNILARAQSECARTAFQTAKSDLDKWRTANRTKPLDRDAARIQFERMRSGDPALARKMMIAARNGEGLSDRDLEGLLDDIAELNDLDREAGEI